MGPKHFPIAPSNRLSRVIQGYCAELFRSTSEFNLIYDGDVITVHCTQCAVQVRVKCPPLV